MASWHPDWIVPQWPAPARVHALMTTVAGGVSQGLFASMNLGDHVGDAPDAVAFNRAQLAQAMGAQPVFMRQVHGVQVIDLAQTGAGSPQADGALCNQPGLACAVLVADCLPILITHASHPVVAALHAGWRGLSAGIVEAVLPGLARLTGLAPQELAPGLLAWLGPCIGPQVFEVGGEVRQAFVQAQPQANSCFRAVAGGKFLADLPQLARLRLQRVGIHQIFGNDGNEAWCTVTQSRFFSHRRVHGRAGARPGDTGGRMVACIWLA